MSGRIEGMNGRYSMNSETMTLSKFFKDYYIIPDYQRGYSWQDKQIEDFWEDITSAIKKEVNHYFGTVYLKSIPDGVYEVIDGQQRLTTLFVLLIHLYFESAEYNEFWENRIEKDDSWHLTYTEQNKNKNFLERRIFSNIRGNFSIDNIYKKNLQNLRNLLKTKINNLDDQEKKQLFDYIKSKLIIDVRYIDNKNGITDMVVFETLNNRGKPLSILEKLKNRLMYLNSINGFELKDEINQVWAEIYKELGTINEKYINKNISIDDDFVSAHLTIYRRSENTTFSIKGTEEKLFQMFCQNPEKFPINERSNLEEWNEFSDEEKDSKGREENLTKDKIQNYINSLQKFCSAWVKIINFCEIKDENIKKCLMLDASKELKILLTTLCLKNEKKTDKVFEKLSKVLFRQNLPNEWNRTWDFATLAYYFNNQDKSILYEGENYTIDLNFLNTEFKTIIEEKLDLESIADGFKNYYISGKGAAGFYKWKSIKYFLYEYDKQLRRRNCCDIPYEDIEVEHIIPQNLDNWNINPDNRISRNVMINTLGNLTILNNSKNSSISNSDWENKRVAYNTDSTKSEREILQIANNNEWNLHCIGERGDNMFRFLEEIIKQYGNGVGGNNWEQVKTKILYYDGNRQRAYYP